MRSPSLKYLQLLVYLKLVLKSCSSKHLSRPKRGPKAYLRVKNPFAQHFSFPYDHRDIKNDNYSTIRSSNGYVILSIYHFSVFWTALKRIA